jgi:Flp pilus assembly protein TadD
VLKALDDAQSDHVGARLLSGIARLGQGDVPGATKDLQLALDAAPSYPPAAFYLGACYAAAGRDADAIKIWRASIVTEPNAPWVYTELIDAFIRTKDAGSALQLLDEAAKVWPDNDDFVMRQAVALALAGQGGRASTVLDPFLARHPDDGDRLVLGMHLIYDARVAGQPIESTAADRDKFVRYFDAYKKLNGPLLPQAEEWKRLVDR